MQLLMMYRGFVNMNAIINAKHFEIQSITAKSDDRLKVKGQRRGSGLALIIALKCKVGPCIHLTHHTQSVHMVR